MAVSLLKLGRLNENFIYDPFEAGFPQGGSIWQPPQILDESQLYVYDTNDMATPVKLDTVLNQVMPTKTDAVIPAIESIEFIDKLTNFGKQNPLLTIGVVGVLGYMIFGKGK